MKTVARIVLALAVVLPAFARFAAAQEESVTVTGQAAIYNNDIAQARDKALDDAKRKAVEQALGTVVSSETITQNFQLVSDRILSKASGYIKKYSVVKENKDAGVFSIDITAIVSKGDLSKDFDGIKNLLRAKGMPRILLMIAEQNIGQSGPNYWWGQAGFAVSLDAVENAFIDSWSPKGFRFVDRQALKGKISVSNALKSITPGDDAVKEFAGKAGAEVVIVGQAIATDNGTVMNTQMHSCRVNLSLRAIRIDNGEIIATSTQTAAAVHIDVITGGTQAMGKAAQAAADDLLAKLTKVWGQEVAGNSNITLTIKNVGKSKIAGKLREVIGNQIRGVQEVRQRSYSNKVLELEIEMQGRSKDLATELEEKNFGDFEIDVNEVTDNTITATLKTE